jgi:hypothetical protein
MIFDFGTNLGIFFLFYWALQKVSGMISPHVSKTFNSISTIERLEWSNQICSLVHANIVTIIVTYYILHTNHEEIHSMAKFRTKTPKETNLIDIALYNSIGYVLYDLFFLVENYPNIYDFSRYLHHIIMLMGLLLNAFIKYSPFLTSLLLFSEISTPFWNIGWFMLKRNLKNTKKFLLNEILFWLTFLVSRVLAIPFCLYLHYKNIQKYWEIMSFSEYLVYPLMIIILYAVNIYWFLALTKKVIKIIFFSPVKLKVK